MSVHPSNIILTTLNARFIHSAFGLRYLYANLGDLQSQTLLKEFTIHERPIYIAEKLLELEPKNNRLQCLHLECQ